MTGEALAGGKHPILSENDPGSECVLQHLLRCFYHHGDRAPEACYGAAQTPMPYAPFVGV